jgi:type I restriction enzyme S subunit
MRDGWTEAPLAAVATRVTEKNRNLLDKVFTVSAEYGLIDQETFFNKRVASKNLLGYTVVQPGMLVYNKSYSVTAPYGVITRNHHEHPGVVSPLYLVFSPQEDKVLGTYLELAANSAIFFNSLKKSIKEGGRAHGGITISLTDFFGSEIPLAPIAEQRRIVDVVSSVDAYIDALQQHVDTARTARNAVLHELLTAGGDDWTETTLGDIAELISRGRAPSYCEEDGVVVLNQKCIRNGRIHFEFARLTNNTKKAVPEWAYLKVGDSLINSTGVGTLGRASFVSQINSPTTFDSHVTLVRPLPESCFASFIGLSLNFRENEIEMFAGGSTGQTELSREAVSSFPVTLPPIAEQKRIVEIVSSMDDVIEAAEGGVVEAKNLRSGLLSDLLSGEHEIPVSYDQLLGAA